eukprot:jgi/Chrzof1/12508/Cz06g36240.t1
MPVTPQASSTSGGPFVDGSTQSMTTSRLPGGRRNTVSDADASHFEAISRPKFEALLDELDNAKPRLTASASPDLTSSQSQHNLMAPVLETITHATSAQPSTPLATPTPTPAATAPAATAPPAAASSAAVASTSTSSTGAADASATLQSFVDYLLAEANPAEKYPKADVVWRQTERDRVYNFLLYVPYQLERLMWFGTLICLVSFLVRHSGSKSSSNSSSTSSQAALLAGNTSSSTSSRQHY